jgi:DNA-binding transcriptional MerR regulator
MKMRELVKQSGVSKETIHYYIREGLLRKPRKTSTNSANYNENHLEQLRIIKDLRDNYFFPIPVIKQILKNLKKQSSFEQTIAHLHNKYFRPLDRLLEQDTHIVGTEAFLRATGLNDRWSDRFEEWGVITPSEKDGAKVYSHDDVLIGRLLTDMSENGLGPAEGFDPIFIKKVTDAQNEVFRSSKQQFYEAYSEKYSNGAYSERALMAAELLGIYTHLLYRKSVKNDVWEVLQDRAALLKELCPDADSFGRNKHSVERDKES